MCVLQPGSREHIAANNASFVIQPMVDGIGAREQVILEGSLNSKLLSFAERANPEV
jgi:hypothetical protein